MGETWSFAATQVSPGRRDQRAADHQPGRDRLQPDHRAALCNRDHADQTASRNGGIKTVDLTSITAPGPLSYLITARNAGNTDLTGLAFTDTMTQGRTRQSTTLPTPVLKTNGDVAKSRFEVDEVWTYEAQFPADQGHIDEWAAG